jgi:DNA polymerase
MANTSRAPVPAGADLGEIRAAARGCRACPLWERATQTVFGAGPPDAALVMVGEQPGDREDVEGAPFVGPAGKVLDRALEEAGIDRDLVYITNAVKHFKWRPSGHRRIHDTPNERELAACRPWLDAEIELIRPQVLVALGATAARALLGREFRVTRHHGEVVHRLDGPPTIATIHPSPVLRARDDVRAAQLEGLVADLRVAAELLRGTA